MKNLATFVGVCLTAALIGCASTQKTAVSPGAVDANKTGKCCASSQASPGTVSDANCSAKCSAQCPHAAKSGDQVSPGAVGESTPGCCKAKSSGG